MGYSEKHCRLCGVTFNIGRRRLRSEPEWMGWECTGDAKLVGCRLGKRRDPDECGNEKSDDEDQSDAESEKMDEDEVEGDEPNLDIERLLDEEGDDDYQYEESEGDEALEYQSEDEMTDLDDDQMDIDSDAEDDTYALFKLAVSSMREDGTQPPRKHDCFRGKGYDGKVISAEEMEGCCTAQCLISKAGYGIQNEEPFDLGIEKGGRYCLSGLTGHVCSRDMGGEDFVPVRHGFDGGNVDSINYNDPGDETTAFPFHTTCFDIFSRLSRKRFGYVNLEPLGHWMFSCTSWRDVAKTSSDPNVDMSADQWWVHHKGCEYLAANPLLIPGLKSILDAAVEEDEEFDHRQGAFDAHPHEGSGDSFSRLPLELRLLTLSYLDSPDIANLRLASRTFRQLPITLWRDLLLKEMPFLWEVWSDDIPYIWATVKFEDVVKHEEAEATVRTWRERTSAIIRSELPDSFEAWKHHIDEILAQRDNNFLEKAQTAALKKMVTGLPPRKTNWYKVYTGITRNWDDLKGLKNRKRIWKDIGVIVERLAGDMHA